eukprot:CAMPEP_0175959684 /NCGR_PEP_ID=MMETSP0108-20121206/34937_1 /TAXON_ID=195067 ORGANISM="Goniomonas pacifica, Strain CCMP1869" /NCGR_SAMPLE_ID=MMETSP0108 /ASSEMBLY_ACC=CAM_ASM_000204 /LENGTH=101 /DNA_ID=CAMNT_0017287171 /DNA_START=8 /DNA_END=313 /DNA_ORIENTATION=+
MKALVGVAALLLFAVVAQGFESDIEPGEEQWIELEQPMFQRGPQLVKGPMLAEHNLHAQLEYFSNVPRAIFVLSFIVTVIVVSLIFLLGYYIWENKMQSNL